MASTYYNKLGKWFVPKGRTAVINPNGGTSYLFALECADTTLDLMAEWNDKKESASAKKGKLISTISEDDKPNIVCDIPEGIVFYLTDALDGSAPSASNLGCFITWSE